jgi:predicted nucleotide-binding protein
VKASIEKFISSIPYFDELKNADIAQHFGYFISVVQGDEKITPKKLEMCFEAADLAVPKNISVMLGRSKAFVRGKEGGWRLHRDARLSVEQGLKGGDSLPKTHVVPPAEPPAANERRRNVMVIHGRDQQVRDNLFNFLRAIHLNPIEWEEAVKATGKASPYVGEILDAAFEMAQAVVVLLTPDERVELRKELCSSEAEFKNESGLQSRPNVFLEAGMALARNEARTILVTVGASRPASDLGGRHALNLTSPEKKNALAGRLRTAGCDVNTDGDDWLRVGKFEVTKK